MLCPARMARAFTVNRTVALAFPSGCAEMMASEVTVMWGPPIMDRKQVRWAGSTVRAAACALLRPSASQNARAASGAAAAWAADSVPEARGGRAGPLMPLVNDVALPLPRWEMLVTWPAGGADTRTATPKS